MEAGNCYVNRHITGAIVQRQSFGGWKEPLMGPGAKAGGPNYVAQFGTWVADGVARRGASVMPRVRDVAEILAPLARTDETREWLQAALSSDAYAWREELVVEADPSSLRAAVQRVPLPAAAAGHHSGRGAGGAGVTCGVG